MTVQELIQKLSTFENAVIAIDGPSGSGKSTLAKELEQQLGATVFHTDDYFLPASKKTEERLAMPGGNLDSERMKEEVFDHLKDAFITSHHYNCSTEQLEHRKAVKRANLIIIEGVYSMLPIFQPYYDYMIVLEVDQTTQLKRILARSNAFMLARFETEWIPLEEAYFQAFDIKNCADALLHL